MVLSETVRVAAEADYGDDVVRTGGTLGSICQSQSPCPSIRTSLAGSARNVSVSPYPK